MKSTMGFAPVRECPCSSWQTEQGRAKFLQTVQSKIDAAIGEPVEIHDASELVDILSKAVSVRGDDPSVVNEAIEYCVQMCVNRVRMGKRLDSIRDNAIRNQPRGCYNREKGCLPMKEVRGTSTTYADFIKQQQSFRR